MKKLITFFLFFPLLLVAQNQDPQYEGMTCTESRAFNMIYTNSIESSFDPETLLHVEEFELEQGQGKELLMLLGVSPIPCSISWNKKEYRRFLRDFGYPYTRKFDRKVESYCECITENYSIFVWNTEGGFSYGLLLTTTDPD